jgi:hypothetical protein
MTSERDHLDVRDSGDAGRQLPQRADQGRALQPSRSRLPVPSLRVIAARALPVAARVATAAMATLAAERALSRAVTRIIPAETTAAVGGPRGRRVVVTERVHLERYRIRR